MYKKFILAKTLDKVMQFCCRYTLKRRTASAGFFSQSGTIKTRNH
ncbi:hypothetical protein [Candidatus Tisiphia endosymbiont of Parasteatoda lunata]